MENTKQSSSEETKSSDGDDDIAKDNPDTQDKKKHSKSQEAWWKINKPLIPLKIGLFFYFGAGASVFPFVTLFLKQKGLTIAQLSFIYMINPFIQFIGSIISGVIADKIGRSKPVLLGNILLAAIMLNGILLIPNINKPDCGRHEINLTCRSESIFIQNWSECDILEKRECKSQCAIDDNNISCSENKNKSHCVWLKNKTAVFPDVEISTSTTMKSNSTCQIELIFPHHRSLDWCRHTQTKHCNLTCYKQSVLEDEGEPCEDIANDNSTLVFCMSLVCLIFFHASASNGYRIMDVTSMSMVNTYDSDFGRERFWSIFGTLIFSVISGYAVGATTKEGSAKNYETAIYLYDAAVLIAMFAVAKLEVAIEQPGKQMVKKSLVMIRNLDILAFIFAVLILGACWCFSKQFSQLYLDSLGAPSILLGLNPAINSLFGLPFLLCSNFWVDRIGSGNLLVLGFAGHTAFYIGYTYLVNPWWSLALEMTGILNYHLLWVAVVRHSHSIAPQGLVATVISTAGALHYGIGKGSGSVIGGLTMSKYGALTAFKVMAATSGGAGTLYALFLYFRYCCTKKDFKTSPEEAKENIDGKNTASYIKTEVPNGLSPKEISSTKVKMPADQVSSVY